MWLKRQVSPFGNGLWWFLSLYPLLYTPTPLHPGHTLAAQVTPAALLLKASSRAVSTWKWTRGKAQNHVITWTPVRCLCSTEELPALQPHLTELPQHTPLPYKVNTAMQKVSAAHSTTLLSTSDTILWLLLFEIYLNRHTAWDTLTGDQYHKQGKQNWC